MTGLITPNAQDLIMGKHHSSEFTRMVDTAAVASRAKHDQRRANLRMKRNKEHIMQVVESFIKDQVVITTLQAYIESNFLNDMINFQHQVVNDTVERELRKVIKSVLSDIYFAHISTLFLENFLISELKAIAIQCHTDI